MDEDEIIGHFPQRGGGEYELHLSKFEEWEDLYDKTCHRHLGWLGVWQELRQARQWLIDNPRRRKKDTLRYLSNWLSSARQEYNRRN